MPSFMKSMAAAVIALSVGLLLAFGASIAFAQEPGAGSFFSLRPFVETITPLAAEAVATLVAALIGWISYKLNKNLGLSIEAKHREALQSALMSGVYKGLHYVEAQSGKIGRDVNNEILAEALRYVERSVPDAIRHFGLTPDRIRELLEAKLPYARYEPEDA